MQIQTNLYTISRKSKLLFLQLSTIMLIGFFGASGAAKRTPVIQTAFGPVQGSIRTTFNSVKYAAITGIPFAKPPLGNLRFKPPVDPDPWSEVYNATKDAPDCIHYNPFTVEITGDEDCLYLNVATRLHNLRKAPAKLRAVVVWIYGGGFITGSSTLTYYRPDNFIEKDCVYVSLNYRGGAFGYMSLNHPDASGNAAPKDLVQGLKWVQTNIAQFGGNPKKVTIMGQSAGAALVGYLVISNSAANLFHGAISISGAPLNSWAFQSTAKALHQANALIDQLGIKFTDVDSTLEALYDVPARNIVIATSHMSKVFGPFTPTLENESVAPEPFLTECAVDKYLTGSFNHVPQIMGFEDKETLQFVSLPYFDTELLDNCVAAAEMYHMDDSQSMSIKEECNGSVSSCDRLSCKELRKYIDESSNLMFKVGIDQTQKFLATNNENNAVYYYNMSFHTHTYSVPECNKSLSGSAHGNVLNFIFHNPDMNYSADPTDPVHRTVDRMVTMWTNFIKYHHPTPDLVHDGYALDITWPNSGPSGIILEIGNELSVKSGLATRNLDSDEHSFWPYLRENTGCDCNSSISSTERRKTIR